MQNIRIRKTSAGNKVGEINFKGIVNEELLAVTKYDGLSKIKVSLTLEGFVPFYNNNILMQSVFKNLIENAAKFRHSYEPNPELRIQIELGYDQVLISFKDNGIGIDPTHHDKIFRMFYCVPGNCNSGSGLGLFTVKEAVKKMKGKISVVSELGEGTEFKIIIPNKIDIDLKRKFENLIQKSNL